MSIARQRIGYKFNIVNYNYLGHITIASNRRQKRGGFIEVLYLHSK